MPLTNTASAHSIVASPFKSAYITGQNIRIDGGALGVLLGALGGRPASAGASGSRRVTRISKPSRVTRPTSAAMISGARRFLPPFLPVLDQGASVALGGVAGSFMSGAEILGVKAPLR